MSKKSNTASEVQLKRRRTSLEKKLKEELINIVLRKDKIESKYAKKIVKLTNEVNCNNEKISNFDKQVINIKLEAGYRYSKLETAYDELKKNLRISKFKANMYKYLFVTSVLVNILIILIFI